MSTEIFKIRIFIKASEKDGHSLIYAVTLLPDFKIYYEYKTHRAALERAESIKKYSNNFSAKNKQGREFLIIDETQKEGE